MKTKAADFLDIKDLKIVYGIKVHYGGRWIYAGENGEIFKFKTVSDRNAKRKELSKLNP